MFTGIIETVGKIAAFSGHFLTIDAPSVAAKLRRGSSVAIDGVCLTSLADGGRQIKVEVMPETLERSNLGERQIGDLVNLELGLEVGGRLDGHLVSGHIDATGTIKSIAGYVNAYLLTITYPPEIGQYLIKKGSIAINGISLTVVDVRDGEFVVSIIPHTWQNTNLARLKVGERVNLEADMVAKYIERMLPVADTQLLQKLQ